MSCNRKHRANAVSRIEQTADVSASDIDAIRAPDLGLRHVCWNLPDISTLPNDTDWHLRNSKAPASPSESSVEQRRRDTLRE
jgi:hypothetical protein